MEKPEKKVDTSALRKRAGDLAQKILRENLTDALDVEQCKVVTVGTLVAGLVMLKSLGHPPDKSIGMLLELFAEIFGGTMKVHSTTVEKTEVLH